jgi:predicted xylose isomerase-like sugar epimerase
VPIEPAYTAEQWTEKYRKEVSEWAAIARASGAKAD